MLIGQWGIHRGECGHDSFVMEYKFQTRKRPRELRFSDKSTKFTGVGKGMDLIETIKIKDKMLNDLSAGGYCSGMEGRWQRLGK